MNFAQSSQLKASRQIDTSKRAHNDCLNANLTAYSDLHSTLNDKVKTSQRLVEKLESRARSVDVSIHHTKSSLAQVEQAHRAKEAPLNLCTWRIDQREKRPLREQVRDPVEMALEEERTSLMESQRKLSEAAKRSRAMIAALQDTHAELKSDIDDKRQALSVDDMCLRTTHRVWQAQIDAPRGVPPSTGRPGSSRMRGGASSLPATGRGFGEESGKNETVRQSAAQRHCHTAASKEHEAAELREECTRLIERCERAQLQTLAKSSHVLQERINENQHMRKNLEAQIRDTQDRVDHTKHTIRETHQQIKSLEEPMQLVNTRDSWRKQRALREQINDPVSTRLEDQKLMLIHTNEALRTHRMEEKGALIDLRHNKERLKSDLKDKTAALHIDLNCLAHEALNWNGKAQRNISKTMLSKAIKVDPTFTPSGGSIGMAMSARF